MGENSLAVDSDATVHVQVQRFLDEALTGPDKGGIAGGVRVGTVHLDAYASAGWGVEFARHLPNGSTVREHLGVADINVTAAGVAIGKLLRAA